MGDLLKAAGTILSASGSLIGVPSTTPGIITMTIDTAETMSFWAFGNGETISIDWGDGSIGEEVLDTDWVEYTHSYSTTNNTVIVSGAEAITNFDAYEWPASWNATLDIDAGCVGMKNLYVRAPTYLTGQFVTHPEWVNLKFSGLICGILQPLLKKALKSQEIYL